MIINLTPHAISLADQAGEIIAAYAPSGEVARVSTTRKVVGSVDGADIVRTVFGEVLGLPASQEGVFLLVSSLVAQAAKEMGRGDIIAPDTGPTAVRENGQVVAVRGFQTF